MPRRDSNALALSCASWRKAALAEITEVRDAVGRPDASTAFDRTIEHVDLVIESAPESMDLKQKLFTHMDAIAGRVRSARQ